MRIWSSECDNFEVDHAMNALCSQSHCYPVPHHTCSGLGERGVAAFVCRDQWMCLMKLPTPDRLD